MATTLVGAGNMVISFVSLGNIFFGNGGAQVLHYKAFGKEILLLATPQSIVLFLIPVSSAWFWSSNVRGLYKTAEV